MNRGVKDGDKIMVTKFSGRELDVPHLATVAEVFQVPGVFILENAINGSDVVFKDVPDCDVWFPMSEYVQEKFGSSFWEAGSREAEVGDKITVLKYNGNSVQRDATVKDVFENTIGVQFFDNDDRALLHKDSTGVDEWHFADDDITLDAAIYDEEETLQHRQAHAYYDDEALSPSYSEAVKAGMTFADYTGVNITEESLDFEPKEEEVLRGITAESLNFEEAPKSDAVNHPSHYGKGRFETIEMIEEITKGYDDGFVAHCVGTAVKYESRAPFKHDSPLEDLRKARKYLEFAIDHLERMEGE